jgi:hypothetical protein
MRRFNNRMIALLGVLTLIGCSKAPTIPEGFGRLEIKLTDAPAEFEAVNITFTEISAHIDSQWITVRVDPITVNLLEFSNGRTFELASENVPAGHYTQIRLKITAAEVVVDGQVYPVTVPSGAQTGLKLVGQFIIVAGETLELVLDFDAQRSVVRTGPPHNPFGYILKPTIRVIGKADSGAISGAVSNPQNAPVAYAVAGSDTVATTMVKKDNGKFVLGFLPAGVYAVSIADTLNQSYRNDQVLVAAGAETNLGTVTLQ